MTATTVPGPWGAYRDTAGARLGTCGHHLVRMELSLHEEIAPDWRYLLDKASQLRDTFRALAEELVDVEWWLDAHDESLADRPGADVDARAGHPGGHLPEAELIGHDVFTEARSIVMGLRIASDRLAETLPALRAGWEPTTAAGLSAQWRVLPARLGRIVVRPANSLRPGSPGGWQRR